MAYSTLQDSLEVFENPEFEGFIAYQNIIGRTFVLSNPLTKPSDYEKATRLFLKQYPAVIVCQASVEYAKVLRRLGFYVTGFGCDNILSMDEFEVSRRIRPNLHRFYTRIRNLGFSVVEDSGEFERLKEINKEWLEKKQNKREFRFLARPFISNQEPDVRIFLLKNSDNIVGFCTFDPIYSSEQNGEVESYVIQHLRVGFDQPRGATDFLLISSLNMLKQDGYREISLGLSLLHQRANTMNHIDFVVEFLLNMFYHHSALYKCKTVAEHKDRYHTRKDPTYIAFRKRMDIKGIIGIVKVNGLQD